MAKPAPAAAAGPPGAADLSCFTASLAQYLGASHTDPLARIARSVRLAIRVELPDGLVAFSHHRTPLCELGDGRQLRFRGTPVRSVLLRQLARELSAVGQALVVTYTAAMPWSVAGEGHNAPHFVLVSGRRGNRWHVVDPFSALLPAGRQAPYDSWIGTDELVAAMSPPRQLAAEHRLRKQLALGVCLPVPGDELYQWLCPTLVDAGPAMGASTGVRRPDSSWITDPTGALACLRDLYVALDRHPHRARFVDDMWAAAQHHIFRYRHLAYYCPLSTTEHDLVAVAMRLWGDLPMALRFAVDSMTRGRHRPALLTTTFEQLSHAEAACADLLARHGYLTGPPKPQQTDRWPQQALKG